LRKHETIHLGIKQFKCDYKECGKMFTEKSDLEIKLHLKRRLKIKSFKCNYNECDMSFVDNSELKKHISSIHLKEKSGVTKCTEK
jgi:uncharacterized Zn-finger protein